MADQVTDSTRVSGTVERLVRSNPELIEQMIRDAINYQDGLVEAWWTSIPEWHRGKENKKRANEAIRQRNKYVKILKAICSTPNAGGESRNPAAERTA